MGGKIVLDLLLILGTYCVFDVGHLRWMEVPDVMLSA